MSYLFLVSNKKKLYKSLDNPLNLNFKKKYVLDLSTEELILEKKVIGNEFDFINVESLMLPATDNFLNMYITLIGDIGAYFNNRTWWATDIASKNRFTSRMQYLLEELLIFNSILEQIDFDILIIYKPETVLLETFKNIASKKNIKFISKISGLKIWIYYKIHIIRRFILLISEFYDLSTKLFTNSRSLKTARDNIETTGAGNILIKSFIYDSSFDKDGKYRDAFFGRLPEYVKNYGTVVILANILGNYKSCLQRLNNVKEFYIVPLESYLTFMTLVRGLFEILFSKLRLVNSIFFNEIDVNEIINRELYRTKLGISLYQYLHYEITKNLLAKNNIEKYIYTYENNPWEKMSVLAFKGHSPQTKIVGYQHTVIPQASANMFNSKTENNIAPCPDRILTVGAVPRNIMYKYGEYDAKKIDTSCGLRFEYLFNMNEKTRKTTNKILLVLEGIPEVYKMVNYTIRELKNYPGYKLTIRTHPVLPFYRIKENLLFDIKNCNNVYLSENKSLKEDLLDADVCIYWGSTVSLEALSMGIPLINYKMPSPLSYDPLFELKAFKWEVTENDPLIGIIKYITNLELKEYLSLAKQAKEYLGAYLYPVKEDYLRKFLCN